MYFINLFYLCYSLHILEAINESNALTKTKRKKIPCVAVAGRLPGRSHSIQGKCNDCSLPTDLIDPESSKLLLHHWVPTGAVFMWSFRGSGFSDFWSVFCSLLSWGNSRQHLYQAFLEMWMNQSSGQSMAPDRFWNHELSIIPLVGKRHRRSSRFFVWEVFTGSWCWKERQPIPKTHPASSFWWTSQNLKICFNHF